MKQPDLRGEFAETQVEQFPFDGLLRLQHAWARGCQQLEDSAVKDRLDALQNK